MNYTAYINPILKNYLTHINFNKYLPFNQFNQQIIHTKTPFQRDAVIIFTASKKMHVYAFLHKYEEITDLNTWTICDIDFVKDIPAIWYAYIYYPINDYFIIQIAYPVHCMCLWPCLRIPNVLSRMSISIHTYRHIQANKFINFIKYRSTCSLLTPISHFYNLDDAIDKFYNKIFNDNNLHITVLLNQFTEEKEEELYENINEAHFPSLTDNMSGLKDYYLLGKQPINYNIQRIEDISEFFISQIPKSMLKQKFMELKDCLFPWLLLYKL